MKTISAAIALFFSLSIQAFAQTTLFGLGDSDDGYHQLDTSSIQGSGTKAATAWVTISLAPESQAKKLGADVMLIKFALDCPGKTIQPLEWKAKTMEDQILAKGVFGKEQRRKPQPDSIDELLFQRVCTWKKR